MQSASWNNNWIQWNMFPIVFPSLWFVTFTYGFLVAPFARYVKPVAQMIVRINCNVPGSKPNLICMRPPIFESAETGPPAVKRLWYRDDAADAPLATRSGELGDVTKTLGLSRRSYASISPNERISFINIRIGDTFVRFRKTQQNNQHHLLFTVV